MKKEYDYEFNIVLFFMGFLCGFLLGSVILTLIGAE